MGGICTNLDPDSLAEEISKLADNDDAYRDAQDIVKQVRMRELSLENFKRQLRRFHYGADCEPSTDQCLKRKNLVDAS